MGSNDGKAVSELKNEIRAVTIGLQVSGKVRTVSGI